MAHTILPTPRLKNNVAGHSLKRFRGATCVDFIYDYLGKG